MLKNGRLILFTIVFTIFTLFFSFQASAEPERGYLEYSQPEQVGQPNLLWELIKVIFALALVLGIAYLLFQFLSKRNNLFLRGEFIQIIENSFIAPNRSISLVEVGNRFLVLGVTEHNISLLAEITDPQLITLIKEKNQRDGNDSQTDSFSQHLSSFLNKLNSVEQSDMRNNSESKLNNLGEYFKKQVQEIKLFSNSGDDRLVRKETSREKDESR